MNKLVSIIVPCYNSSRFIRQCIDSVLNQSYSNWEMLIVDDCSTDKSRDIILKYSKSNKKIKTFFLEKNVGPAEARNIAINNATGKYIAFLDSDDVWRKHKLERQINFMNNNKISFSFTSYQPISENGEKKYSVINVPKKIGYHEYLKNTIIGCLTVVVDREEIGEFQMPNISSSHDMALWLLIMKRDFFAFGLNENLAYYRLVSTSNTSKKWKAAKDVWNVYRSVEKLNIFYSFICFIGYVYNAIKKRI